MGKVSVSKASHVQNEKELCSGASCTGKDYVLRDMDLQSRKSNG